MKEQTFGLREPHAENQEVAKYASDLFGVCVELGYRYTTGAAATDQATDNQRYAAHATMKLFDGFSHEPCRVEVFPGLPARFRIPGGNAPGEGMGFHLVITNSYDVATVAVAGGLNAHMTRLEQNLKQPFLRAPDHDPYAFNTHLVFIIKDPAMERQMFTLDTRYHAHTHEFLPAYLQAFDVPFTLDTPISNQFYKGFADLETRFRIAVTRLMLTPKNIR